MFPAMSAVSRILYVIFVIVFSTATTASAMPNLELSPSPGMAGDTVMPLERSLNISGTEFARIATATITGPVLELSPSSGRAGETVTATGSSFNVAGIEFAQATIRFNGNVVKEYIPFTGSPKGGFTVSFVVPSDTPPGTYVVQATGPLDSAEAVFMVTAESSELISDSSIPFEVPMYIARPNVTLLNRPETERLWPPNIANSAPILELSPSSGQAGETVTAIGNSFNIAGIESSQAKISFNGNVVKEYVSFSGYPNGEFSASFTVPFDTPPGTYVVEATGPRDSAEAMFTVTPASIAPISPPVLELSPSSGQAGETVTALGSSFNVAGVEFAQATISFNGNVVSEYVPFSGYPAGEFTASFTVPFDTPPGTYVVEAIGPLDSAEAMFTVTPASIAPISPPVLELSPSSGQAGETVTAFGSSFNIAGIEFAQATIRFDGNLVKENVAFSGYPTGEFTASFTVPSGTLPGTYVVEATGPLDSAEAMFTVTPASIAPISPPVLELSPSSGQAGEAVTAFGSSFNIAGIEFAQATIKFDGNVVKENVAFSGYPAGEFTASFTVPSGMLPGTYVVEATGPLDSAEAMFTVTAASASPVLALSPSSGRAGETVTAIGASFNVAGIEFAQATISFNGIVVKENIPFSGYPNGEFAVSFKIPSDTPPGTYAVEAKGPLDSAEAMLTVIKNEKSTMGDWSAADGKDPDSGHSWAGYKKACENDVFDLSFNLDKLVGGLNANINMAQNGRYGAGFINLYNGSISVYLFKENEDHTVSLLREELFPLNIAAERIYLAADIVNPLVETELKVNIAYDKGHIQVYVNRAGQSLSIPVIDYYDENPLPPGNLDFETLEGSSANLSEVVTSCSSQAGESGTFGIFYAKDPDFSYLINATSDSPFYVRWGEVPANQFLVMISATISFDDARAIARQLAAKLGETTNQEVNVVGEFEYINLFQIETQSQSLAELVRDISFAGTFSPLIVDVFPNQQVYAESSLSQNPLYMNETIGKGYQIIGVQRAWDEISGSGIEISNVNVGIIDDGIYLKDGQFENVNVDTSLKIYPEPPPCELSSRLCGQLTYAGSHGTGIANLIASDMKGNGLQGIASCLPKGALKISMINITGKSGRSFVTSSMLAFQCEIQNGSSIISCSMGLTGNIHQGAPKMYQTFFSTLANDARFDDVLFIFSAGNNGTAIDGKNRIPNGLPDNKALPNVITVGNVMDDKTMANGQWIGSGSNKWQASRSNYNSVSNKFYVTLAAPGEQAIWGGNASGGFINWLGGTSMAASQVTAAATLIRSIDPCLTAGQIKDRIIETSSPGPDKLGGRILDVYNATAETIRKKTVGSCSSFGAGESIDLPGDYNNYTDIYGYTEAAKDIEIRSAVYSDSNPKILYCQDKNALMVYNRIYLAGSELGEVKKVTYRLPESFPNAVQVSTNVSNSFEIWFMAWGTFLLRADIETNDGQLIKSDYNFSFGSKLEEAVAMGIPLEEIACDGGLSSRSHEEEIAPRSTTTTEPSGFDATINIVSGQYKGYTVSVDGQQIGVEGQGQDILDGKYAFTVAGNQQHLIRVDHPLNWKWWQYFYNAGDSVTYDF